MRVAVASGKGGTGKTTVATSLARALAGSSRVGGNGCGTLLLDCDVEAPDAHVFLRPSLPVHRTVTVPTPSVDTSLCDACGECAEVCRFQALTVLPSGVVTFPALCHGCGNCARACPREASTEVPRRIGVIE